LAQLESKEATKKKRKNRSMLTDQVESANRPVQPIRRLSAFLSHNEFDLGSLLLARNRYHGYAWQDPGLGLILRGHAYVAR
jgi:hypothetical protein